MRLFEHVSPNDDRIDILLECEGDGVIKLTPFGCDELIKRKNEKTHGDPECTKKFINDHFSEIWLRCDEDLIDIYLEFGENAVQNGVIRKMHQIPGVDMLDDSRVRVCTDECTDGEGVIYDIILD